jgi:ribonuclease VapC
MVIDSSALLAVLLQEPAAQRISDAIEAADVRLMSVANALEAAMVIEARSGIPGARDLDRLLLDGRVEIVPVTREHFDLARAAWRRYGKGRHPARLNICDCLAYALAKATGEPLLFVGDDFAKTDLTAA